MCCPPCSSPVDFDVLAVRSLFAAIIQRLAGLSMGLIEMTLLKFYTYVVESAPHDSWPVFAFSRLANGPLKCVCDFAIVAAE